MEAASAKVRAAAEGGTVDEMRALVSLFQRLWGGLESLAAFSVLGEMTVEKIVTGGSIRCVLNACLSWGGQQISI